MDEQKKITILTSIGAGLEYYDFVIYAMLAGYISKIFFPSTDHYASLMATYAIFAIGYLARPVGGVIFGVIGDRYGRKYTFMTAILLMAISTCLMGLLPSYASIGISATVTFSLLRLLQGLSFGAELPGSLTFLTEHVSEKHRGTYCGFMVFSVGLGATIGSFVPSLISYFLSKLQILEWGWRIPFILGAVLAIIGFIVRRKTTETPYFIKEKKKPKIAIIELFKIGNIKVLYGIGIMIFPACFVIFFLCMPTYLHDAFGYKTSQIYPTMTIGFIWSTLLIPVFGWISDKVGRKKLLFFSNVVFIIIAYPLFNVLFLNNMFALILFVLVYQTIIAAMAGCYFAMLPENFPTAIRFTGVAFCYNIAYVIASFIPLLVNYTYKAVQSTNLVTGIFIVISLLTAISSLLIKNVTGLKLE